MLCFQASLLSCHNCWPKTSPNLNVGPPYTVHGLSHITFQIFTTTFLNFSMSVTRLEYENGFLRSTFKPEEINLSLRRPKAPTLRVDAQATNTLPLSRSGDNILRMAGITGFPVISPPPTGYTTPTNLPPGRKTSFINYANPKELWPKNK